jgi:hypothetical protein
MAPSTKQELMISTKMKWIERLAYIIGEEGHSW